MFDIADPESDHLVIAGEIKDPDIGRAISSHQSEARWQNKTTLTGFLPESEIAELLAAADAVVLPFRNGGGEWNSSIHGAVLQGTFVLTTSRSATGFDKSQNVYSARIDDLAEMRRALDAHAGKKREMEYAANDWESIALQHHRFYHSVLGA